MAYKVIVSKDAKEDLDKFISYLITEKNSIQAALNLMDDYDKTMEELSIVAGSLKYCDNQRLRERGYKRINFLKHKYFMLYRVVNDIAYVDRIYHFLQDYENKMI